MTLREALNRATEILSAAEIEEPGFEAELLLRHTLKKDRVRLFLDIDTELTPESQQDFFSLVERRRRGEPSAYIIGHREFYGLDFSVNTDVLIPRPETELLVEKAIELAKAEGLSLIADIGTGSGAIAISLAVNLPEAQIYATDISAAALEVARENCRRHGVENRVTLLNGDLLKLVLKLVDIIIANLPYVRDAEVAEVNTRGYEPALALDGGKKGLQQISRLCDSLDGKLKSGGHLLLEIGQGQAQEVIELLKERFPDAALSIEPDLAGIERMVTMTLPKKSA